MSRPAKYSFNLTPDGIVRLVRSDGAPIDEDQVEWFRRITSNALKADALAKSRTHVRSAEQEAGMDGNRVGTTRGGVRFDIDPAVDELERVRTRLGFKRAPVARAAFLQPQDLTDYVRGASRPGLEALRTWAAVLGRRFLLVPSVIAPKVIKMIEEWEAENEKTRGEENPAA